MVKRYINFFPYFNISCKFNIYAGIRCLGNVWNTMGWWWMDRAFTLHSTHQTIILKHSKTYAEPVQLSYAVACLLFKNVRCVMLTQMHNYMLDDINKSLQYDVRNKYLIFIQIQHVNVSHNVLL